MLLFIGVLSLLTSSPTLALELRPVPDETRSMPTSDSEVRRHKARAQKRGGGQMPVPMDVRSAETQYGFEPVEKMTAEKIFERRWAMTLLERTIARLREEYERDGKAQLFEQLKVTLTEPRGT